MRFFEIKDLRFFEGKTSKKIKFRGEDEASISEVFGRPTLNTFCCVQAVSEHLKHKVTSVSKWVSLFP